MNALRYRLKPAGRNWGEKQTADADREVEHRHRRERWPRSTTMNAVFVTLTIVACSNAIAGEWRQLPSLQDKEGFAGMFAGVSNGALIVAGGANFPDKKPWDGGKKTWYDSVFVLEKPNGEWKSAGKLPRALGYGVSVTYGDGVVCVGGSDSDRHYADVFRLEWKLGKLVITELPKLTKPVANNSGALIGDFLYIAGGQEKPDANTTLRNAWRIDLSATEPQWEEIEACPGNGRMLAVAAGFDGKFWMAGGVDLSVRRIGKVERCYLKDAYFYDPQKKSWWQIDDLPHSVVAPPTPAPVDASGFYVLGGDDGSQINVDHKLHRGFLQKVLRYDPTAKKWVEIGELFAPRVTVPCVVWNKMWVIPSGEMRPGVRSPEVWAWMPGTQE